jgi:hypothetical protein
MTLSLSSMFAPRTSLWSGMSPVPLTSLLRSSNVAWANFRKPGGNRPIAAVLTAFSPSRRSRHYARAAIASAGSRMAIPSGRLPVCQLNLWPDSRFGQNGLAQQTRSPARQVTIFEQALRHLPSA